MTKSEKAIIADVIGMLTNAINNEQEKEFKNQPTNQDLPKEEVEFIKKLAEDTKDCVDIKFDVLCGSNNDCYYSVCRGSFNTNTWHVLLDSFLEKYEK